MDGWMNHPLALLICRARLSERPRTRPSEEAKWPVLTGAKILHGFLLSPCTNGAILGPGKPRADPPEGKFRFGYANAMNTGLLGVAAHHAS